MHTPHDAFFRSVFAHPRRLAGLLAAILPPRVVDALALRASWGQGYRAPSVYAQSGAQAAQPSVLDRGASWRDGCPSKA